MPMMQSIISQPMLFSQTQQQNPPVYFCCWRVERSSESETCFFRSPLKSNLFLPAPMWLLESVWLAELSSISHLTFSDATKPSSVKKHGE
jgi:hypothetical protein